MAPWFGMGQAAVRHKPSHPTPKIPALPTPTKKAMPTCAAPQPTHPIALLAVGPSAQPLLAPLRQALPTGVHLLPSPQGVFEQVFRQVGLLILLVHPCTEEDSRAALDLAQQVQDNGFGVHTLCLAVQPSANARSPQRTSTHYALQALQAHTDALVQLSNHADIDLPHWLAQAVGDMAQSLDDDTLVGLDWEEITRLVRNAGTVAWASTQASGPDKALQAVQQLWRHPFLAGMDVVGVRKAAVWVCAAPQALQLSESRDILQGVMNRIHPDARLLYSVRHDAGLGDALRVGVLLTGVTPAGE